MKTLIPLFVTFLSIFTLSGCDGSDFFNTSVNTNTSTDTNTKTFTNITFNNASFEYDGTPKSIFANNVPDFATVTYEGNEQVDIGKYTVTAHIRADNYTPLDLNALLTITKATFSNITFSSRSFVYDGLPHSLEVVGAPEFATITYEGNDKTDAGSYTVVARVSADNYATLELSASLTISRASFGEITFESETVTYDGKPHSIYVSGAPDFASVAYTNNEKTSVGTYTVTARISAPNYNTLTKTATLRILGRTITGITFNDQTFVYDGNKHSISISGELPEGVSVSYSSNNGQTNAGRYQVTAILTGEGYEKLELKAYLIIEPAKLENPGYFSDKVVLYDGNNHSIEVTSAPKYATVTYKCLNGSGTNTFKNPGEYEVEATVKISNNEKSTLKATLFIINGATTGVDSTKTPLHIDENLTWDELYEALDKDNYSYDYFGGSYDVENIDDPMPSDLLSAAYEDHEYRGQFVTDGKQGIYTSFPTGNDTSIDYKYYQEVGDDIVCAQFSTDEFDTDIEKIPKAAFSETVCKPGAESALVALEKGDNGEFLVGMDGDDYYKDDGFPFIQDGKFIVLMMHPRTLSSGYYRYFYRIYEFYNIGNSAVSFIGNAPSRNYVENRCGFGEYRLGGVRYRRASYGSYNNMKTYYSAELYVSYATKIFLKPGTYTVLPYIYNQPVRAIVHYSYYSQYYNYNQSGYAFNLYINKDGEYQGEYADLGSISRLDVREVTSHGGVINYYSDWAN